MNGVKRLYINLDWSKMKNNYVKMNNSEISCLQKKWNPFKKWEQGFDSDCMFHCSNYKVCREAFYDKELELENHFKEIIVPCENKLWWGDEEVEIKEINNK